MHHGRTPRFRSLRIAVLSLGTLTCLACGDDGAGGGADGGGMDARAADAAGTDGATGRRDGSTLDAGPDAARCPSGTLCGMPAVCCSEGDECVDGTCVPACETGVRCGADRSLCCAAGQLCVADECAAPGPECRDSYDCMQPGEFCEPTLGRCLPQPDPLTCEIVPTFRELETTVEWSYEDDQVISIPVVADIDGDEAPEVVLNLTQQDGQSWPGGELLVLDGRDGTEQLRVEHAPAMDRYGSHGRSTIALGDVSGDGLPDIVYAARDGTGPRGHSLLVAIDHEGTLLWTSHDADGSAHDFRIVNGAVTLANFDDDAEAEVVVGASLIDDDGLVVWDEESDGPRFGTNEGYRGGISAVVELDGDPTPEIVSGRHAWDVEWASGDPPTVTVTELWVYAGEDGYPAIADLDQNGSPEVVLVAAGEIIVLDGATGELWCGVDPTGAMCASDAGRRTQPLPIPGGSSRNRGGPPTIADFDGDERPEIGVAGGYAYSVYDVNRAGETVVQPEGDPMPDPGALFVRWSRATQDLSSNATGSSVFDFQGDGAAEVVYADECFLRVYSGTDGSLQLERASTSATIHEYPLVVDVDGDNNSEILVIGNDSECDGMNVRAGLFVYGDANDEWVPTRRVWTQHTYHVTNATSAGNVPEEELPNWSTSGLNNYRQNVQGEGVFNAPDLTIDLSVGLERCFDGELVLRARVANEGALGVPAGVEVTFFEGLDASGTELGTATTTEPILPGGATRVTLNVEAPLEETSYYAVVDGGGASGAGSIAECNDDNNDEAVTDVACLVLE